MNNMIIYFIVCMIMLALVVLRIKGEMIQLYKKYPDVTIKESNFLKAFIDIVKLIILFLIPLINIWVFFTFVFLITDERIEEILLEKVE